MSGFALFPKIRSSIEWLFEHGDAVVQFGWSIVAAIILLFAGKFVSRLLAHTLEKLLLRRSVDITIVQFFTALVRYITLAFFTVAALGRVGIETSSIIAVIGAAGLAIGLALQSSLSNFAAGVMLVSLRPFRAGEIIQIGLIIGTVEKVHIFSTTLLTGDSKSVVIPNGKIIADNIINYSRHPMRRIDLVIGVGGGSAMDVAKIIALLLNSDVALRDLLRGKATIAKRGVPTLMVPTTAGTGSEATPNSIVAVPEEQLKVGIVSPEMIADAVILDGNMIRRLPRKIAASTGIDALCHALNHNATGRRFYARDRMATIDRTQPPSAARARVSRTRSAPSAPSSSSARQASARPSCARRWPNSCSTPRIT